MPLLDFSNPDVIKFVIETYDKTSRLCMKWNRLHADKLQEAATLHREEKGYTTTDVLKEVMAAGMSTITRDHKEASYIRRRKPGTHILSINDKKKGHTIAEVGLGNPNEDPRLARPDTDLSMDPIMRPVDPKQQQIIYQDLDCGGRKVYLNSRNHTLPEKKYYFAECSQWVYGWRLGDSYFGRNAPKYGRVWSVSRDIKGRSGPQPDPRHYKHLAIPGNTKCTF